VIFFAIIFLQCFKDAYSYLIRNVTILVLVQDCASRSKYSACRKCI